MPYKYVTETQSEGFGNAPVSILAAVKRLSWAGREIVKDDTFQAFNELLAVGYFEVGKMEVCTISFIFEDTLYRT